jgi:precorrin-8X/cobalt-precorrin-8 methylmutase
VKYVKNPAAIYERSFAAIRAEADLSCLPREVHPIAMRLMHASGMIDLATDLRIHSALPATVKAALVSHRPIFTDCEMTRAGIIGRYLPASVRVLCTLHDPLIDPLARRLNITRSAAAVQFWRPELEGSVVLIGNAPTALYALLELIDGGAPKPAAIIAMPVGFVGAAEAKAELTVDSRGIPYATLLGRRGGSAMTAAAFNAITASELQ